MKSTIYLLFLGLIACKQPQEKRFSPNVTVIENVNALDIRSGVFSPNTSLVIDSGKIVQISNAKVAIDNARVIDGTSKYVIPGLAEMHAHIPAPNWGRKNTEETLFLYLANGITTIRGMLGDPVHLDLREKAKRNEILSPRIITSSPSLNGRSIPDRETAIEKVTQYQREGYDFLKMHPGIKSDVFDAVVQTANQVNIPFAGHVSLGVGVERAMVNGYGTIDHVDGFIEGLVTQSYNPNENGFFGFGVVHLVDTNRLESLIQTSKKNEVWIVPTQSLFERWFSPIPSQDLASASEMKYMPKSILSQWIESKNSIIEDDNFSRDKWADFNDLRKRIIKRLHSDGHGLLLGSDAPQVFNVPGFSIHHELKAMTECGLTNLEALQIGSLNPAKYLNEAGQFGEISVGASADLILLENDPLKDLNHLQNPNGVMVRGQWISKQMIDDRLEDIAQNSQTQ